MALPFAIGFMKRSFTFWDVMVTGSRPTRTFAKVSGLKMSVGLERDMVCCTVVLCFTIFSHLRLFILMSAYVIFFFAVFQSIWGGVCCIIVEALVVTGCILPVVSVLLAWVVAHVCSMEGAGSPRERLLFFMHIALTESAVPWPPQARAADRLSEFLLSACQAGYLCGYSYVYGCSSVRLCGVGSWV